MTLQNCHSKLVTAVWVANFINLKLPSSVVKSVIVSCGHKMGKFGTKELVGGSCAGLAVND